MPHVPYKVVVFTFFSYVWLVYTISWYVAYLIKHPYNLSSQGLKSLHNATNLNFNGINCRLFKCFSVTYVTLIHINFCNKISQSTVVCFSSFSM